MKIKPKDIAVVDSSTLSRPVIQWEDDVNALLDTGAQVCVWYKSLLLLRKFYAGKAGISIMTDAGKGRTPMLSLLCNIPLGGFIFKNVPVSYNPKLQMPADNIYHILIGTCIIKTCKLFVDLWDNKVMFIPKHPYVESNNIIQDALRDPDVVYKNMSIGDLYKMQKEFGPAVQNMSLDEFIDTVGVDAVMQYVESISTVQ